MQIWKKYTAYIHVNKVYTEDSGYISPWVGRGKFAHNGKCVLWGKCKLTGLLFLMVLDLEIWKVIWYL
jgi:hypothetical protein